MQFAKLRKRRARFGLARARRPNRELVSLTGRGLSRARFVEFRMPPTRPKFVLLIEDNCDHAQMLIELLDLKGYRRSARPTVQEA